MPGGGPAEPAGHRDHIAGLGTGAGDRLLVAQIAERGDRDGDGVTAYDVPADDRGAGHLAFVAQPVHQLGRPGRGELRGHDQAEQDRGGHRAHRRDVGEVLGGGLAADVVGGGPVAPEVPALQEDVGAGDHPPVRRGDHRGIVTRPDPYGRSGGEPGGELPDQPELPQLAHGALHAVALPMCTDGPYVADDCAALAVFTARVSPLRSVTRYRGVPSSHMILVAALEVPWYRPTS